MAKRNQPLSTFNQVLWAVVILILIIAVDERFQVVDRITAATSEGLIKTVVLITIGIYIARLGLPWWRKSAMFDQVDAVVIKHLDALVRRRTMLVRKDAYGKEIHDKWDAEVEHFMKHHVRPALGTNLLSLLDQNKKKIAQRIAKTVAKHARTKPAPKQIPDGIAPDEFESLCASVLREAGWDAQTTPFSCDQGVDVIAEKNGMRVVLQCKLYAKPVGNKAVQEIAAGKAHQLAELGAVVTNSSYTSAAEELARANGILLLHFSDLAQLENLVNAKEFV